MSALGVCRPSAHAPALETLLIQRDEGRELAAVVSEVGVIHPEQQAPLRRTLVRRSRSDGEDLGGGAELGR